MMSPASLTEPRRPGAYAVASKSRGKQPVFYKLTVPEGTLPGATFLFTAEHRRGLTARCPPTSKPGDVLQIAVSPEPETQHVALKIAVLTAFDNQNVGGGTKPMLPQVELANQEVLSLLEQKQQQRQRQQQQQQQQQQVEKSAEDTTFVVTVPPTIQAGKQFVAQTPQGDRFLVTCPPDAKAGDSIRLQLPANNSSKEDGSPKDNHNHNHIHNSNYSSSKVFQITAPEGVRPNQVLPVLVCGKRIPITLPSNVVPGQILKLKLPVQQVVDSIELNYEDFDENNETSKSKGWCRTIRMSDLKFQWVKMGNNNKQNDSSSSSSSKNQEDIWKVQDTAFCRNLVLLEGNDARMRTGFVELVPTKQAVVDSEFTHHHRTLVSYATIAHIQTRPLEEKTTWFQTQVCNELYTPWEQGRIKILVRREHLVHDSVKAIMSLSRADLHKRWRMEFLGEPAIDSGGVMREWFQLVTDQMFNADFGLWLSSVNNQICMHINPASDISCPDDHLIFFRFLGRVMGRALFDRQLIKGHMVRHLYKHLLGWPITFEDLEAQDEEYYQSLQKFTQMDDVSVLCLDFTVAEETLGVKRNVDLIPGGSNIEVTSENLPQYLEAILKYRMLDRTKPQISELLLGFFDVIPEPALTVFDPNELELLLCGLPTIDMDDWKSNTNYSGLYSDNGNEERDSNNNNVKIVKWFWEIVQNDFDQEMKARLLQFVTGTSGVPNQGFSVLQGNDGNIKKFAIHGVSSAVYAYPRAHTCFNRIDLPNYSSKEQLFERLKAAITLSAVGFDME